IILQQLNCAVQAVTSSKQALETICIQDFDIIFADVGLPDMDGPTLVKEIRNSHTPNRETPIIMLTAHSDEDTRRHSFAAGATDFFVKPLSKQIGELILNKYVVYESV
ncbi:MAG TPA: response regulator, partial [Gammaproteobacteria bacterium]|nr:response regulator [Gammaproteobacteria bacterium]